MKSISWFSVFVLLVTAFVVMSSCGEGGSSNEGTGNQGEGANEGAGATAGGGSGGTDLGGSGGDPENPVGVGGMGGDDPVVIPMGGEGGDTPVMEAGGTGGDDPVVIPMGGEGGNDPGMGAGGTGGDDPLVIPMGGEGGNGDDDPEMGSAGVGGDGNDFESGPNCADIQDPIEKCFGACEWIITCLEEGPICIQYDMAAENDIRTQCREYCMASAQMSTFGGTICGLQNRQCEIVLSVSGVPSIGLNSVEDSCTDPQEFVTQTCAGGGCHIGNGQNAGGLNLDDLDALVGVASNFMGVPQITAGDHENSYIWRKMDGENIANGQMPLGRPAVSQEDLDAFAHWIDHLED